MNKNVSIPILFKFMFSLLSILESGLCFRYCLVLALVHHFPLEWVLCPLHLGLVDFQFHPLVSALCFHLLLVLLVLGFPLDLVPLVQHFPVLVVLVLCFHLLLVLLVLGFPLDRAPLVQHFPVLVVLVLCFHLLSGYQVLCFLLLVGVVLSLQHLEPLGQSFPLRLVCCL